VVALFDQRICLAAGSKDQIHFVSRQIAGVNFELGKIKVNEGKLSQENIRNPMRERNHQNLCAKVVSRITIDFQPPFRHTGTVKSLAFLVVCLVVTPSIPAFAQSPAEHYTVGIPRQGSAGIRETTQAIMQRERESAGRQKPARTHPVLSPDVQNLPSNPGSPDAPIFPLSGSGSAPGPKAPQVLTLNFLGATLADTEISFPPDSMGAAGPSQFIVALNGRIRSFNKSTGVADGGINANTDVFFKSVLTPPATNNFSSDPHIRYDRLSGHWFVVLIDVPGFTGSQPNRVIIAVSGSSTITPSTVWTFFQFQGDSTFFADYPTLGIDAHALYIGVNLFGSGRRGTFGGTTAFVVRKSSILGAGPIVVTTFANLVGKSMGHATGPFAPQGVDNYDPASTEGYVIGVDAGLRQTATSAHQQSRWNALDFK